MGRALLDVLEGLLQYRDYWLTMICIGIVGLVVRLIERG